MRRPPPPNVTVIVRVIVHVLIVVALPSTFTPAAPDGVRVSGRPLTVNGQSEVPRGLMGVHADTELTPRRAKEWGLGGYRKIHFVPGANLVATDKSGRLREPFRDMTVVIDCQGDRYYPAPVLTNPDYEAHFAKIGAEYARRCAELGWKSYVEFWNEPYLNWAERSRKNYDPKYYDVTKATEDGPVIIKGRDEPLEHLRWRRLWAENEEGKIVHLVPVPEGAEPGDTFTHTSTLYFMPKGERRYTVVEKWDVYDPTAVSFWSGAQNREFYLWMFIPWAKAIKETHPDVTVIGGWDFRMNSDDWKAWEILYKPTIDAAIEWLDGISEHHYGSDTRANAATYELVVAYAVSEHEKWLRCFNTETAGCVDPAVPGNRHGNATPYGAFNYGLRDIVELCYRCPGKAVSRAAHGSLAEGWGGGGDEFLFKLLKGFRGRLIHATSDDLKIWPVASLDGERLVVVLYNDHASVKTVPVTVEAPAGTRFTGGVETRVEPTEPKGPLEFRREELDASGESFSGKIRLPARSGIKLTFELDGRARGAKGIERRQFFAGGLLRDVTEESPATFRVELDESLLSRSEAAHLKVVFERLEGADQGTVSVNGKELSLPASDWITEIAVDPEVLERSNTLEFTCSGKSYRVDVASIVLDATAKGAKGSTD